MTRLETWKKMSRTPKGSLFTLSLEREAGTILPATDPGSLLCTRHRAYLTFSLPGKSHHCPFFLVASLPPREMKTSPHGNSGKADPADSSGNYGFIGLLRKGSKGRRKEAGLWSQCSRPGCHMRIKSHRSVIPSTVSPKQWLGARCCSRCWGYGSKWDLGVGSVGGQWEREE